MHGPHRMVLADGHASEAVRGFVPADPAGHSQSWVPLHFGQHPLVVAGLKRHVGIQITNERMVKVPDRVVAGLKRPCLGAKTALAVPFGRDELNEGLFPRGRHRNGVRFIRGTIAHDHPAERLDPLINHRMNDSRQIGSLIPRGRHQDIMVRSHDDQNTDDSKEEKLEQGPWSSTTDGKR